MTDEKFRDSALLASTLSKQYKHLWAVKDINFEVNKKDCFGLIGKNGAGKSTTFKIIAGEELPDEGYMSLNNNFFDKDRNSVREYKFKIQKSTNFTNQLFLCND